MSALLAFLAYRDSSLSIVVVNVSLTFAASGSREVLADGTGAAEQGDGAQRREPGQRRVLLVLHSLSVAIRLEMGGHLCLASTTFCILT